MTHAASLATLRDIRKRAQGAPMDAIQTLSGSALTSAFSRSVRGAIMPRRITLSSSDGARLDVLAKSRRVIQVLDASPAGLWAGGGDLDWRDCDCAAQPTLDALSQTVDRLAQRGDASIECALPPGKSDGAEAAKGAALSGAEAFYEAHAGFARGFVDDAVRIDIPAGSRISEAWLRKMLESVRAISDTAGERSRILRTDSDSPIVLAEVISGNGSVALVVAEDAEHGAALERRVLMSEVADT